MVGHQYIRLDNSSNGNVVCQMLRWHFITEADSLYQCRSVTKYSIPTDSFVLLETDKDYHHYLGWEFHLDDLPFLQFIYMDKERFDYYFYGIKDESRCDSIQKNVPIIQRYRLKLEDFQKLDWIVPFPPTEAMKDMDIYPPYKDTHDD